MKKKTAIWSVVLAIILIALAVISASIDASNKIDNKEIIGTWIHMTQNALDGERMYLKINKNATYEFHNYYGETLKGKCTVKDGVITLMGSFEWKYSINAYGHMRLNGGDSGTYKKIN